MSEENLSPDSVESSELPENSNHADETRPEEAAEEQPSVEEPLMATAEADENRPEAAGEEQPSAEDPPTETAETDEAIPEGAVAEAASGAETADDEMRALIEAIIYVTEEPLAASQIAAAMGQPLELVQRLLSELAAEYEKPNRGLTIREVAGGYKMGTKPEHHDGVRGFVKNLKPPLKLSLAALETLAVIAYKQPITGPEILEIRGVQGGGVLKTLLDRKLIATAGRKAVVGKPMLYKTTKEFLLQFGLKSLAELPTLKEFEELKRMALSDDEIDDDGVADAGEAPADSQPEVIDEAVPAAASPEPEPEAKPEPGEDEAEAASAHG